MSDDLVKRLRFGSLTTMGSHRMNLEAATRIEELEAEIASLRATLTVLDDKPSITVADHVEKCVFLGAHLPNAAAIRRGDAQAALDKVKREARAAERERCARILDRHDSVPCKPLPQSEWSDDFKDGYEAGQMDAAASWQTAIRRGDDE